MCFCELLEMLIQPWQRIAMEILQFCKNELTTFELQVMGDMFVYFLGDPCFVLIVPCLVDEMLDPVVLYFSPPVVG